MVVLGNSILVKLTPEVPHDLARDATIRRSGEFQLRNFSTRHAEHILNRIEQRLPSFTAGIQEGTVDVEEQEAWHEGIR